MLIEREREMRETSVRLGDKERERERERERKRALHSSVRARTLAHHLGPAVDLVHRQGLQLRVDGARGGVGLGRGLGARGAGGAGGPVGEGDAVRHPDVSPRLPGGAAPGAEGRRGGGGGGGGGWSGG